MGTSVKFDEHNHCTTARSDCLIQQEEEEGLTTGFHSLSESKKENSDWKLEYF